jgi:para-aminobenzoate synthetase component 1
VETRPIKGTRPRGRTPEEDRQMKAELAGSPKDDAELVHDRGFAAQRYRSRYAGGSVIVSQHKRLEAYQNVYHLVSVVEGVLAEGKDLRRSHPGRLSRAAPSPDAPRSDPWRSSTNWKPAAATFIRVRSATSASTTPWICPSPSARRPIVGDRLVFSVGGGIVYDSDPEPTNLKKPFTRATP